MPRGDRTGPRGGGPRTGRGFGPCSGGQRSFGFPRRCFSRGFGRGSWGGYADVDERSEKELLQEQKEFLKSELESIDSYLEKL